MAYAYKHYSIKVHPFNLLVRAGCYLSRIYVAGMWDYQSHQFPINMAFLRFCQEFIYHLFQT